MNIIFSFKNKNPYRAKNMCHFYSARSIKITLFFSEVCFSMKERKKHEFDYSCFTWRKPSLLLAQH
jgi:hypothetical protein